MWVRHTLPPKWIIRIPHTYTPRLFPISHSGQLRRKMPQHRSWKKKRRVPEQKKIITTYTHNRGHIRFQKPFEWTALFCMPAELFFELELSNTSRPKIEHLKRVTIPFPRRSTGRLGPCIGMFLRWEWRYPYVVRVHTPPLIQGVIMTSFHGDDIRTYVKFFRSLNNSHP